MSARVNVGLSMCAAISAVRAMVECATRVCAALGARGEVCVAVQAQTARVGTPLGFELRPRE